MSGPRCTAHKLCIAFRVYPSTVLTYCSLVFCCFPFQILQKATFPLTACCRLLTRFRFVLSYELPTCVPEEVNLRPEKKKQTNKKTSTFKPSLCSLSLQQFTWINALCSPASPPGWQCFLHLLQKALIKRDGPGEIKVQPRGFASGAFWQGRVSF